MADDGSKQGSTWPMPKFRFEIDLGSIQTGVAFQEVSGMDKEVQVIEYRASNSPMFSTEKMPGLIKYGNVTLKRGIFANDLTFWNWMNNIKMNTIKREVIKIKLLDESGQPAVTWTLNNAWPTKITGSDLKSDANEIAVDTLEIAYETLNINNS